MIAREFPIDLPISICKGGFSLFADWRRNAIRADDDC